VIEISSLAMRLDRALFAVAVLGAPLVLFASTSAWGDSGDPPTAPPASSVAPAAPAAADAGGEKKHDPDNRTAIAEWMEKCVEGNKKFLAKDIPGALDLYRQAMQLAPKQPIPHYLFAEAELGGGNLVEAEQALKDAEASSSEKDPITRGKILFLTADVMERQKKWVDAKTAWSAYSDFASKHGDAGAAPATPPARIQAIDDMLKQDKAYDVVRQRIADEAKDKDAGPAAPADAGKKK
jgi:hypothetical protein